MKQILLFTLTLLMSYLSHAQSKIPQLVSFSAIVRDANNQPLINTSISIRLTFKEGGQNGNNIYCALHQSSTNQNGFMSIQLNRDVLGTGCNGAPSLAFENISWQNGSYWMEVEYQTLLGNPFISLGQLELASTFYAFAAATAERAENLAITGTNNGDVLTYNLNSGRWEATPLSGITGTQGPKGDKGDRGDGFQNGTINGQMMYWDGSNWITINPGAHSQILTFCEGKPSWTTNGICPGKIGALNCNYIEYSGNLYDKISAFYVRCKLPYADGDGGPYLSQSISSSGVNGLTANLSAGNFAKGSGNLTFTITGTADTTGTANFDINIAGQTCALTFTVNDNKTINPLNPNLNYNSVNDVENNSYKTITIGSQTWFAEDLLTTKYNDGTQIPLVIDNNEWASNKMQDTTMPMMCWVLDNDLVTSKTNKLGALYNWYSIDSSSNGNKNICPIGWHVPSDKEWNTLINYLDPAFKTPVWGTQSEIAGGKMKSMGIQYWKSPNKDGTNESGFSALPGVIRMRDGKWGNISNFGYGSPSDGIGARWWTTTTTDYDQKNAWFHIVNYLESREERLGYPKSSGLQVRCIKD